MKNKIIRLGEWGKRHWLQLIVIMGVIMMTFLVLVLISWLIGYWANALLGTRFELMSCWSGVAAVASGIATIVGLGKACWTKYGYDSRYNSAVGTMPKVAETTVKAADIVEKAATKIEQKG
ncbi:hypothetical protein ACG98G_00290 [Megasphaera hexanoica]|uniref:Holin n=1 Tax=Megasphaera hexanoica TaxID=1675036 RepID=A0ABW7DRS6_9FIRM|nr:hypothetical protein [Megasphaera hexanoica]AXB81795.1 hypothetical protein ACT01_05870 [Megasphaera hexanoica]